jgi:SPW repeat
MRVIPTRVHGMMDYLIGVLLIAAPWLFNFNRDGAETWVPVILGAGVILYSLFTDYELGAVRRLAMPTHLTLDLVGGLLLAISPWLFGFSDFVWAPHLIVGLVEMGTSLMTRRVPADGERARHGSAVSGRPSGAFRS